MEVTNLHQKQKGKKWRGRPGSRFSFSLIYPANGLFTAPFYVADAPFSAANSLIFSFVVPTVK